MPSSLPLLDSVPPAGATVDVGSCATRPGMQPASVATEPPGGAKAGAGEMAGPTGLVERLRSPLGVRPFVDPGLAGGLRAWLEDGVANLAGVRDGLAVRPGPSGGLVASVDGSRRPSFRDIHLALVVTVFRIAVTAGAPRAPFEDALAALAVDNEGAAVLEAVQHLSRHRRAQLRQGVRQAAAGVTAQWCPPPAAWLPRTNERIVAPLAGGRVVLRSRADLAMGRPSTGRASVCALRLHGGDVEDDGPGRRLLALTETLRSGAAPFRVASYDVDRARLTVEDVTDDHLAASVHDVLAVVAGVAADTRTEAWGAR